MYRTYFDSQKKIWYGDNRPPKYHPNVSVGQVVLEVLESNPNKIGQISVNNGIKYTNNDLRLNIIRVAQHFMKLNYKKGDFITFMSRNHHNLSQIFFASLTIGLTVNCLNPHTDEDEIISRFKIIPPRIICCESRNLKDIQNALSKLQLHNTTIYVFDEIIRGTELANNLLLPTGIEEFFTPTIIDHNQTAIIGFSSGTTGQPKGVMLTHATLNEIAPKLYSRSLNGESRLLLTTTLYMTSGIANIISGVISGATCIITIDGYSPELILRIIEEYKPTHTISTTNQLVSLIEAIQLKPYDLSSLKMYMVGGSFVHLPHCELMNSYLKCGSIYIVYGSSEMLGAISVCNTKESKNTIGQLCNGFEVKIIDKLGNNCNVNEKGEIYLRHKYQFIGYYRNEMATKGTIDSDGWVHTGDLGYFNEKFHLIFISRGKDILNYNNNEISPIELEDVILTNYQLPTVCVVGIPNGNGDDLLAALLLKNPNNIDNGLLITETDIYNLIAEKLPDFKQLRGGVYFIDKFPTTPSGKLLRKQLTDLAIQLYNQKRNVPLFRMKLNLDR